MANKATRNARRVEQGVVQKVQPKRIMLVRPLQGRTKMVSEEELEAFYATKEKQ